MAENYRKGQGFPLQVDASTTALETVMELKVVLAKNVIRKI
jgi:hypothetical protein